MRVLVMAASVLGLAAMPQSALAQVAGEAVFEGKPGPSLRHFSSDSAFARYVAQHRRPAYKPGAGDEDEQILVTGSRAPPAAATGNPEITNNQTKGVDEGGIVKQIGHHLVVLQDGRLFSVDLGSGAGAAMRLTGRIDVYRTEAVAASWYDEMLVLGDRILVTAYNYELEASEITVIRMDREGKFRREGRYLLTSGDYYSTDNYATRLIGDSLVFYAPFRLDGYGRFERPRIRRARGDGEPDRGAPTFDGTDIYAPPGEVDDPVLHTVSVCPLGERMECHTTGFVGNDMREIYVSPTDVYLWVGQPAELPWEIDYGNIVRSQCAKGEYWEDGEEGSLLYRVPIDGGGVGAVAVDGSPTDQFSFEARDGRFRALLADTGPGCSGNGRKPMALLDIPLDAFSKRLRKVSKRAYTPLPRIEGGQVENHFVGDWVIYGGREEWYSFDPEEGGPRSSALFAVPLKAPRDFVRLNLPHNAIRIEQAGNGAVVTGYRSVEGMSVSYVPLGGKPAIASTVMLPGRFETESRSHAFGARMAADGSGLIGLPTSIRSWRADRGWSDSESSDLSYLMLAPGGRLTLVGELSVKRPMDADGEYDRTIPGYECKVSCIDWYGNSRPIFTSGRIFALMGTDLVEGEMRGGRMVAVGRVDMTRPLK